MHDRYPLFVVAPVRSDDHQRHSFDSLRAYFNSPNTDSSQMLRKLLLSKLVAQCENQNKSYRTSLCNHLLDNVFYAPEVQLPSDAAKIKKNFDEIDKASASFRIFDDVFLTPELPVDAAKIKKNFDEIDKASASFRIFNKI
ncbi:uncharacterized protein LOC131998034 [Stomoxys calcitrans]|uniref:uncharacterized protein LOC131998034 n=1 Tax=Stomoxys calcitrans TaxID=35570 RepID=UPI0027E26DB7|nr:uncharacterized protein LOC131998034 [Stomoxys calcitrans]